jgi:subtilisin family serine protease
MFRSLLLFAILYFQSSPALAGLIHSYVLIEPTDINFSETRSRIAVIDTGIIMYPGLDRYLCKGKHFDFTDTGLEDTVGHGTNIAGILQGYMNPNKECLVIYKVYNGGIKFHYSNQALRRLVIDKIKFANLSFGGLQQESTERNALQEALNAGVVIAVAAGNENTDLNKDCSYFPVCYHFHGPNAYNFHTVGNSGAFNSSNYGDKVITDWADGMHVCAGYDARGTLLCSSGSSQSTPKVLGKLIQDNE